MSGSACPAFPARAFCRGRFIFGLHLLGVGPGQQRSRAQCSHTHVGPEPSRAHEANDSVQIASEGNTSTSVCVLRCSHVWRACSPPFRQPGPSMSSVRQIRETTACILLQFK